MAEGRSPSADHFGRSKNSSDRARDNFPLADTTPLQLPLCYQTQLGSAAQPGCSSDDRDGNRSGLTIAADLVSSCRSQSLTEESEAGEAPIKPDQVR